HEHDWIVIAIGPRRAALIEPIGPAKIARISLSARARLVQLLLEALQLLERGEQCPGFQPVVVARIRDQPQDAVAAAASRFECEERFDGTGTGARHPARSGAVRIDAKFCRTGPRRQSPQLSYERRQAVDCLDVP